MDAVYEEFFGQWIPVFFCSYIGVFTCLSEADLVKCMLIRSRFSHTRPGCLSQHVQVRYYVLDSYYHSGHWGYIYIYIRG